MDGCFLVNPAALQFVSILITKDEFTRKLTKVSQIVDELIFGLMQTGMTYRQATQVRKRNPFLKQ